MDSDSPWDDDETANVALQVRQVEWTKISSEFTNAGYREGITAGKESSNGSGGSALQEGFDQGYAVGVPIGRDLGMMRGFVSVLLSFLNQGTTTTTKVSSTIMETTPPPPLHIHTENHHNQLQRQQEHDQIVNETREINSILSRIRFSDITSSSPMPMLPPPLLPPPGPPPPPRPDLALEEQRHAKGCRHLDSDDDDESDELVNYQHPNEMETLGDMFEQKMSVATAAQPIHKEFESSGIGPPPPPPPPPTATTILEDRMANVKNRLDVLFDQLGMDVNWEMRNPP